MHDTDDRFELEWIRDVAGGSWWRAPDAADRAVDADRGTQAVGGFGTDSRSDLDDAAFIALRGPRHDGHDHIPAAIAAGARLVMVDRRHAESATEVPLVPTLIVDDTLAALQRLGAAHRKRLHETTVIAVTGSAGKTTTRRLIHAALASTLRGTQSPRSFNNAIGVPLTLLAASRSDRFLVVEIGTNAPGEIAFLGRIVEPDIVVITSIGRAHLGGFADQRAIAAEKASLIDCRRPGGVVIVRSGIALLEPHLSAIEPLVRFGPRADAPGDPRGPAASAMEVEGVWLVDREPRGSRQRMTVDGSLTIDLPMPGEHNAINALAAVAVARTIGVPDAEAIRGLSQAAGESMRLDASRVELRSGGTILLVNDAYNANPESMVASLRTFAEVAESEPGDGSGRRFVVLGRMLELGDAAVSLHTEVIEELIRIDGLRSVATAWLVGPEWSAAAATLAAAWGAERVIHLASADDATCATIADSFGRGDAVLLKGSRGVALERVAEALRHRCGVEEAPLTRSPLAGGTR